MITKTAQIKARMVLKGYTIKSLARAIGVGEQNLAMKINGKRKFNHVELSRIMKVLDLTPEELVFIFLEEDEQDVS